jgi:hypothetical protein
MCRHVIARREPSGYLRADDGRDADRLGEGATD